MIAIFAFLHAHREPARIGAIARGVGAPRSTVYELVNRLIEAGILEPRGDGGVYFGRAMHYYGADYVRSVALLEQAQKEVAHLAEECGETVQFCRLEGNKYTVVLMDAGRRTFKITSEIGVTVPIPWTASGRLLLGHMSAEEILAFIPEEDFVLADGRVLDKTDFLAEIDEAGRHGYAVTSGLVDDFTTCMAAPVIDGTGRVVATICFVVTRNTPTERQERLMERLLTSARSLSRTAS
ncbi:MAG: IclR family transcriptional regulator [Azospirillaceae bacterium]